MHSCGLFLICTIIGSFSILFLIWCSSILAIVYFAVIFRGYNLRKHATLLWLPLNQTYADKGKTSPNVNERLNHIRDAVSHLRPKECDIVVIWIFDICCNVVRIYEMRGDQREDKRAKAIASEN